MTTTGNLSFTDGNHTGGNLRQINLGAVTRSLNIGAGTTTTIAPDMTGTGGLIKTGEGTLRLTAASANNYTGDTTINAGTLLVAGSISGATIVNASGTLSGGGGTLGAMTINSGGTLSPGEGVGNLTAQDVTLNGTATFALDINIGAANFTSSDLLTVASINLDAANSVHLAPVNLGSDVTMDLGTVIPFIDYTGAWNGGTFAGLADDSTFRLGANEFRISYNGADNIDTAVVLVAIPEPAASVTLLLGGLGCLIRRRRTAA